MDTVASLMDAEPPAPFPELAVTIFRKQVAAGVRSEIPKCLQLMHRLRLHRTSDARQFVSEIGKDVATDITKWGVPAFSEIAVCFGRLGIKHELFFRSLVDLVKRQPFIILPSLYRVPDAMSRVGFTDKTSVLRIGS